MTTSNKQKKVWKNPKYRKHMSNVHKGKHSSSETEFKKGNKPWNKGKKLDKKIKKKMSLNRKGKTAKEKHPNWKGGKSFEKYPIIFWELRDIVRERDNFTCQSCDDFGMDVHHKDCDKNNNSFDNLITLCRSCHIKLHWRIYGKKLLHTHER